MVPFERTGSKSAPTASSAASTPLPGLRGPAPPVATVREHRRSSQWLRVNHRCRPAWACLLLSSPVSTFAASRGPWRDAWQPPCMSKSGWISEPTPAWRGSGVTYAGRCRVERAPRNSVHACGRYRREVTAGLRTGCNLGASRSALDHAPAQPLDRSRSRPTRSHRLPQTPSTPVKSTPQLALRR